jgi:thioredoxin-dependent peroxiredoxin
LGCSRPTPPARQHGAMDASVAARAPVASGASDASITTGALIDAAPTRFAAAELTVVSRARTAPVAPGDVAPSFHAVTHNAYPVESSGASRPRPLVLYFCARDEDAECTQLATAFHDAARAFGAADVDLYGVSADSVSDQRTFALGHALPFGLISDSERQLAAAFGIPVRAGQLQRATVVIGRSGRVARVFANPVVAGHPNEVLAAVRAAQ